MKEDDEIIKNVNHNIVMDCAVTLYNSLFYRAGPRGRAVKVVGLRPLACWDRGFESHRVHRCLSVVSVVCCQV